MIVIDLFADTAAILFSMVSKDMYLPPGHPIISI